jgi:adenine-specific DNA methylase
MLYGAYRDNPEYCEAYVDKETFDKIQEIVKRNIKENTAENRTYLFTGLIKCPHCGRLLSGNIHRTVREGKPTYMYKVYRCPKHRMANACDFKKVVFENSFEKMLLENLEQYIEDAKIRSVEITDSGEDKILKYDIDELNAELERLNYSWKKGRIKGGIEQYDREYDELIEKIELAKQEKDNTEPKDFSQIESVLHEGWQEVYNALDEEHKRAFWRNIISSIEIEWHGKVKRIAKVNFL